MLNDNIYNNLKYSLNKSWLKKDYTKFNTASVAITDNDEYYSGLIESKTHLLDVFSEQGSLVMAVSNKDVKVKQIITLLDGDFMINPLVIKFIIDHIRRTGIDIKYSIYDLNKNKLFSTDSVYNFLNFYKPNIKKLDKIKYWNKRASKIKLDKNISITKQLYDAAIKGSKTHFSSTSKTCYGACVLTDDYIYFSGVYSSFDKRLSLHAEMTASINAIMNHDINIRAIGLVSNKFVNDYPHACGCCRQFLIEIMQKTNIPIEIYCFKYENYKDFFHIQLKDYLPNSWDSIINN